VSDIYKPTIVLDFDGVINSYTSGWQLGAGPMRHAEAWLPDAPTEYAQGAIAKLREHFTVIVQSTRARTPAGREAMDLWLKRYGIEVDGLTDEKPPALLYVDDRGFRFTGDWRDVLEFVDGHIRSGAESGPRR